MHIDYLCDHPELIEELATLNFKEWGEFRPGQTVEDRIEHMRESCGKGAVPSVVVALEGSRLLGGALLIENDLKLRPNLTPWLAGVYVKAEERGRRIASQLVNRVVEEAAPGHIDQGEPHDGEQGHGGHEAGGPAQHAFQRFEHGGRA